MFNIIGILTLIKEFLGLLKTGFELYRKARKENWLKEAKEITNAIATAKTPEQRQELARKLSEHLRSTPS
jgi:hypothetical protein